MNDFMYEVLLRSATNTAFKDQTSYNSDSYAKAIEEYRQNLLTKKLSPGNSHSSQFCYIVDVLEKYNCYLERKKKIGINDSKYISQFSDEISYSNISTLTYYEIADLIYRKVLANKLPSYGEAYFYGCECKVPIYPIKSLFDLLEVQTELKKRISKHYKNYQVFIDILKISFEIKEIDEGDYLIINFPAQIEYGPVQFDV